MRLLIARLTRTAGICALAAACQVPAARVWNLEQLHDGATRHRYLASVQGETGFFWRHRVLAALGNTGATLSSLDPSPIENPAELCLENLIALEEHVRRLDAVAPDHVEWFARVAVEDPARLSRERATLVLGELAARTGAGLPARLGSDQSPAGPGEVGAAIEELVGAVRARIEGRASAAERLAAACTAFGRLDLDLAAGRRALRAAHELTRVVKGRAEAQAPLDALVLELQSLCLRRALAAVLVDDDALVRAAAIRAVARGGGVRAVDVVLFERLRKETEPEPLRAILAELAEQGLPADGGTEFKPQHAPAEWIASVCSIALQHPSSELRVAAMRTLGAVSDAGFTSLREEDWQAWWLARRATPQTSGPVR